MFHVGKFTTEFEEDTFNTLIKKLISAIHITLGSLEHVFRMGGKIIQMSDLHQCKNHEVGIANFLKLVVEEKQTAK